MASLKKEEVIGESFVSTSKHIESDDQIVGLSLSRKKPLKPPVSSSNFIKIEDMMVSDHQPEQFFSDEPMVEPKALVIKDGNLSQEDDDDDMMPHAYDFSVLPSSSSLSLRQDSNHNSRRLPVQIIKRDIIVARSTPLSYMSKPQSPKEQNSGIKWEPLFSPVENIENIVDAFIS